LHEKPAAAAVMEYLTGMIEPRTGGVKRRGVGLIR
jgi:hypothetical protein